MSTFIEDVRSRRVHPPTNQKFDPSLWSAAKNDKTTDDRNRQFAEAGLFFFSQLEEVRTRLPNTLNPFARSPMESLRLIIGFQNLDFRKMQNWTDSFLLQPGGPAYIESRMSAEVEDPVQGCVSVDDSLGVDATSLIVRKLLECGDQSQGPPILHSEIEMQVEELFRLGKVYSYFEELWSECQWADALFDSLVSPPVLRLRQSEWGKRTTISEYRIRSVRIEQTLIAVERWKRGTLLSPNSAWINPQITFRQESGGLLHPEVIDAPLAPGELPMDLIHAEVYQRFYSDELLALRIPSLENLTIKDLLVARRVLAALGNALQARLLPKLSIAPKESFFFAAPLISYESLRKALHTVLRHLSTKAVQALASSFIFGGKTPDLRSLWLRPFIRLGGDNLITLSQPLIGLNLELAIDDWSSKGNLYGAKGIQYEARLRSELGEIAQSGPITDARVHKAPITKLKTYKGVCGDVDLLINVGRTILVGEVKTLAFPARALGVHKNISELRTACEQAARKAKAVAEAIGEVLQITGFGSATDQKNWKVLPLVVSNQAIGVGSSFDGVPIVDRQILDSYLGQGGYYPAALLGPRGSIVNKGQFHSYYDNDMEAEERIEDYLRSPQPVCRYEPFCELRRVPFEQLDDLIVVESVRMNLAKLNATLPGTPA
jgi:hypothetical protein